MSDGGETEYIPSTGDYVDAKTGKSTGENVLGKPPRDKERTTERQIPHTDTSIINRNGKAELDAGATAIPETSDEAFQRWLAEKGYIPENRGWGDGYTRQNSPSSWESASVVREHFDYSVAEQARQASAPPMFSMGPDAAISSYDPSLQEKIWGGIYDAFEWAGAKKSTGQFYADRLSSAMGWLPGPGKAISGNESYRAFGRGDKVAGALYGIGAVPFVGKISKALKGIFFTRRAATEATQEGTEAVARTTAREAGEPVSVANGEYLETWRDFLIPGTHPFDGARYMGLKLALPQNYLSPLGPCQISMFDEIFSNPSPGKLRFHTDDGKAIDFDRPFNFLPSVNAGYPHLELKAPWLRELRLKDRTIVKHFRQYDDDVYRLEKVDDLNGFALDFIRDEDGNLERLDGQTACRLDSRTTMPGGARGSSLSARTARSWSWPDTPMTRRAG